MSRGQARRGDKGTSYSEIEDARHKKKTKANLGSGENVSNFLTFTRVLSFHFPPLVSLSFYGHFPLPDATVILYSPLLNFRCLPPSNLFSIPSILSVIYLFVSLIHSPFLLSTLPIFFISLFAPLSVLLCFVSSFLLHLLYLPFPPLFYTSLFFFPCPLFLLLLPIVIAFLPYPLSSPLPTHHVFFFPLSLPHWVPSFTTGSPIKKCTFFIRVCNHTSVVQLLPSRNCKLL